VFFALIYQLLRRSVGFIAGPSNDLHNDIEILVLRHQLMVPSLRFSRRAAAASLGSTASTTSPRITA